MPAQHIRQAHSFATKIAFRLVAATGLTRQTYIRKVWFSNVSEEPINKFIVFRKLSHRQLSSNDKRIPVLHRQVGRILLKLIEYGCNFIAKLRYAKIYVFC